MKVHFEPTGRGNFTLEIGRIHKRWTVSYRPFHITNGWVGILNRVYPAMTYTAGEETSEEETALLLNKKWYILDGDYRNEVLRAFKRGGIRAVARLFLRELKPHTFSTGTNEELRDALASLPTA